MPDIVHTRGDATAPAAKGVRLIAHVLNDVGGWGTAAGREAVPAGHAGHAGAFPSATGRSNRSSPSAW